MNALAYIEARYEAEPNSGCWLWTGSLDSEGYGIASVGGQRFKAHRLSWALHNGDIPDGLKALHHCDTPPCINPAHLFLGTQLDNIADMVAKGRQRSHSWIGSESPVAKLTEPHVCLIRNLLDIGCATQAELARVFRMSPMAISRIARFISWPHVSLTWDLENPA